MQTHDEANILALKKKLIDMGHKAADSVERSAAALFFRRSKLARDVIQDEEVLNQMEIKIDEEGRKICALQHPLAHDFRLLGMILKVNTDLERVGDHAVNIAEKALWLNEEPPLETNIHLKDMAKEAQEMLTLAMSAFDKEDVALARKILGQDDVVDEYYHRLYQQIAELIEKDPLITKTGMNLVMVGHNLERVADLACNIAENVIYLKQGKEVRHRLNYPS